MSDPRDLGIGDIVGRKHGYAGEMTWEILKKDALGLRIKVVGGGYVQHVGWSTCEDALRIIAAAIQYDYDDEGVL